MLEIPAGSVVLAHGYDIGVAHQGGQLVGRVAHHQPLIPPVKRHAEVVHDAARDGDSEVGGAPRHVQSQTGARGRRVGGAGDPGQWGVGDDGRRLSDLG